MNAFTKSKAWPSSCFCSELQPCRSNPRLAASPLLVFQLMHWGGACTRMLAKRCTPNNLLEAVAGCGNTLGNAFVSTSGRTQLTGPEPQTTEHVAVPVDHHSLVAFTIPERQAGCDLCRRSRSWDPGVVHRRPTTFQAPGARNHTMTSSSSASNSRNASSVRLACVSPQRRYLSCAQLSPIEKRCKLSCTWFCSGS